MQETFENIRDAEGEERRQVDRPGCSGGEEWDDLCERDNDR